MAENNKKENTESFWEALVNLGIAKAMTLIWVIYVSITIVAMFLVHWFSKHK
jgi:hypothetical protein